MHMYKYSQSTCSLIYITVKYIHWHYDTTQYNAFMHVETLFTSSKGKYQFKYHGYTQHMHAPRTHTGTVTRASAHADCQKRSERRGHRCAECICRNTQNCMRIQMHSDLVSRTSWWTNSGCAFGPAGPILDADRNIRDSLSRQAEGGRGPGLWSEMILPASIFCEPTKSYIYLAH